MCVKFIEVNICRKGKGSENEAGGKGKGHSRVGEREAGKKQKII